MNSVYTIIGPNFSGRSKALTELLRTEGRATEHFFIGAYAETGLSGIASTVGDELAFYKSTPDAGSLLPFASTILSRRTQRVATLSGGEQTLLALQCFESSNSTFIGIDTALEQLDAENRVSALQYLSKLHLSTRRCCVVDNREVGILLERETITLKAEADAFALNLRRLITNSPNRGAPAIELRSLHFEYSPAVPVFADVSLALYGGCAYRLYGPNGSGKSTLLKLLAGALPSSAGDLYLDGHPYNPYKRGNEMIAWAMQDPDHQWVSTSVASDLAVKIKAFEDRKYARLQKNQEIGDWIGCFGIGDRHPHHLLDLPKALRKRLSWLWPLTGTVPWLALDEPTIGQDRNTSEMLADALQDLVHRGYGVLFVTHDDDFARLLPHRTLVFRNRTITIGDPEENLVACK
jgi:energy-coupling factor transporter ATP-binding protein EcfA2